MSLNLANPVRRAWDEGRAATLGWCSIPSSISAEALALLGWDAVVIDLQHGMMDYSTTVGMLHAIEAVGGSGMVRVPWNDPGLIMKLLDAGSIGVICPMVGTREECERFVGACRYAPKGYRSFGPLRVSRYYRHLPEYLEHAEQQTIVFAMIETAEGMANIDSIAATPGLDGLYLGPSDLALSSGVGMPGLDREDDFIQDAHRKLIAACRRHGLRAGLNANSVDYARQMLDLGYDMICLQSDLGLLQLAGEALLADMRNVAGAAGALRGGPGGDEG